MSDPILSPFHAHYQPSAPPADPDEYLRSSVEVDGSNIREEYMRVSADVAFWSNQFAHAHRRMLLAKILLERASAGAYLVERETAEDMGKKVTEAMIDARVRSDPDVQRAEAELVEAEFERERLKGVTEAIRAKRDMLVSLGATMRAEMQGDPSLRGVTPTD